ncbi:MAG: GntR family transcriptional regulator [Lachnospiraceae bacterium]|jgi:DNA-binding GntR family transcriptional regulator|nr:GntR family transcriptional regulator [Lachnospiraceae bacterium]
MKSKADEAYNIIKEKIVNLQLQPSADISEEKLIQELNISRTPIREALQKLAKDGFVIVYPRKGTIVADITLDLINSIYEIRILNEPHMSRIACMKIHDEWIQRMKAGFLSFGEQDVDIAGYIRLDYELHTELTRHTNNIFLKNLFKVVNDHNHRIRIQTSRRNDVYGRSIQEHLEIIKALEGRNEAAVEEAVRTHILTAKREAFDYFY